MKDQIFKFTLHIENVYNLNSENVFIFFLFNFLKIKMQCYKNKKYNSQVNNTD